MSSPRRIAVVILTTLIGWALQWFAGVPEALALGLLVGFVVALMVPARGGSCGGPRD